MTKFKTTLDIILKEFQEGVDFTVESKEKIIFHSEELVNRLMQQSKTEWFLESVKRLIPSTVCSYEENEQKITLTFRSGNNKNNNQEIEKGFKKNTGIDITYHEKNSQGGGHVISKKFKNSEIEKQKNELIGENVKGDIKQIGKQDEGINRHFVDNGNSLVLSTERKGGDEVVEESHTERNQKRREQETEENKKDLEQQTQNQEKCQDEENSSVLGGESQSAKKENNQLNQLQETDNKDNGDKNIYYGVGLISLILVVASAMIVWAKKKK